MFCDSHCHIFKEYYENIDEVIKNAKDNGINRLIVAADNHKSCLEVLDLVNTYDNVYGCLGLHPENCLEDFDYEILKTSNKLDSYADTKLRYLVSPNVINLIKKYYD